MRLWHKDLIKYLPRKQLVAQWRECVLIAKLLAKDGTPNHILVNKIVDYPCSHFESYGHMVYDEMKRRGYSVKESTLEKFDDYIHEWWNNRKDSPKYIGSMSWFFYWHTLRYFNQCMLNLQEKYDCGGITSDEWKEICRLV